MDSGFATDNTIALNAEASECGTEKLTVVSFVMPANDIYSVEAWNSAEPAFVQHRHR